MGDCLVCFSSFSLIPTPRKISQYIFTHPLSFFLPALPPPFPIAQNGWKKGREKMIRKRKEIAPSFTSTQNPTRILEANPALRTRQRCRGHCSKEGKKRGLSLPQRDEGWEKGGKRG